MDFNEEINREKEALKQKRDNVMHTLGILNNGDVNLDDSKKETPVKEFNMQDIPAQKQATDNPQQTPGQDSRQSHDNLQTAPEQSKQYRELLQEFTKLKREVKEVMTAFHQNIYDMQQELASLKKEKPVQDNQANRVSGMGQQTGSAQGPQENARQCPQDFVPEEKEKPRYSNQLFTEIHDSPGQNHAESPRTGGYNSDDVKIENYFYYGNK